MRCLLLLQGAASSLWVVVLLWRGVCPARLRCSLEVVLVPCGKDVTNQFLSFLDSKVAGERRAQSRGQQVQDGDRGVKLFSMFS
jgi:hypothetical protein